MSEYDLVLEEDKSVNRMHESMKLFGTICNNKWFEMAAIVLFLNKKDLMESKLKSINFKDFYPDYDPDDSEKERSAWNRSDLVWAHTEPGKRRNLSWVHMLTSMHATKCACRTNAKDKTTRGAPLSGALELGRIFCPGCTFHLRTKYSGRLGS